MFWFFQLENSQVARDAWKIEGQLKRGGLFFTINAVHIWNKLQFVVILILIHVCIRFFLSSNTSRIQIGGNCALWWGQLTIHRFWHDFFVVLQNLFLSCIWQWRLFNLIKDLNEEQESRVQTNLKYLTYKNLGDLFVDKIEFYIEVLFIDDSNLNLWIRTARLAYTELADYVLAHNCLEHAFGLNPGNWLMNASEKSSLKSFLQENLFWRGCARRTAAASEWPVSAQTWPEPVETDKVRAFWTPLNRWWVFFASTLEKGEGVWLSEIVIQEYNLVLYHTERHSYNQQRYRIL